MSIVKIKRNNNKYQSLVSKFYSPQAIQLYVDIIALIVGYLIYYIIKFETGWFYNVITPHIGFIIIPMFILLGYWLLLFWVTGLYRNWYIRSPFDEFFSVLRVLFFGSVTLFFLVFIDSATRQPRLVFLVYFLALVITVGTGRIVSRLIHKNLRKKKVYQIGCFIIGTIKEIKVLRRKIQLSPAWGYRVLACITLSEEEEISDYEDSSIEFVQGIGNLHELLDYYHPKEVLITTTSELRHKLMDIVNLCAERKIIVKIEPDLYDIFTGTVKTLPIYGIPLIEINTQLLKPWEENIKRLIDIIASFFVLTLGFPLWLLIGIMIKFESKGPVFYTQYRVGKDRKEFLIYKFRTMINDADKKGGLWTSVNDPRVTRFGVFLRKSHLDEIPQFWNVLKGEMSIVGPRPEQKKIVDKYVEIVPYYIRRLVVRPGITGWWQVNYTNYVENKEEIENRLKDDFYYIENMSLKLDIEIMIRTAILMIKGHGQT